MQQTCFRQYLFNLARLTVAVGLTIGLSGIAMFLLFGRLSGAFGNFLFLTAVLLPVLVCTRGFEKKPFRSVGLTARRCDPGWFFFGVLWAAAWMAVILLVVCLLLGRGDFPIALQQAANGPRLVHYLIVGFCEELLFRGYLFQNLFCEWPFWRRSLLSAILFTLPHSLNANGDATGCIPVWLAGELSGIPHREHLDGRRPALDVECTGCFVLLRPGHTGNCRADVSAGVPVVFPTAPPDV